MNGTKKRDGLGNIAFNQLKCISDTREVGTPTEHSKLSSERNGIVNEDDGENWPIWHKPGDLIEDESVQSHHSWKHILERVKKSKVMAATGWSNE